MNKQLRAFLDEQKLDGLLFIGDSICDSDMYYLSRFLSGDRFTLLLADGVHLLVSSMELGRARKEGCADEVVSTSDYHIMDKLKASGKPDKAYLEVLCEFLDDREVRRLGVPYRFPAGIFRRLYGHYQVTVVESPVSLTRAVKTPVEIEAIRTVQRACENAMDVAVKLIAKSEPRGDHLFLDEEALTSERVRAAIEISLLERGCDAVDTIVAGGLEAADPHARGRGPLPANAPIVLDIFPRGRDSRYFADMTRTVVRGEASTDVQEIYDAVLAAQAAGLSAIRAGISGKEVHLRVCQVFEERGFPERDLQGFTHSTGHGVGLNIHERPSLSEAGEILQENHVVTVEPGLYYPQIGGVRLEDLVVVTENGCLNLTEFPRQLVV
jgi:Xaa-Pro aminopeptidase